MGVEVKFGNPVWESPRRGLAGDLFGEMSGGGAGIAAAAEKSEGGVTTESAAAAADPTALAALEEEEEPNTSSMVFREDVGRSLGEIGEASSTTTSRVSSGSTTAAAAATEIQTGEGAVVLKGDLPSLKETGRWSGEE